MFPKVMTHFGGLAAYSLGFSDQIRFRVARLETGGTGLKQLRRACE